MAPAPDLPGFDPKRPNEARIIDYWLGGKDNFAADRAAAQKATEVAPELPMMAREGRAFLRRVVRYLIRDAGIRQFIDLGCGLPTMGYVHEIAQEQSPETRVVYVDIDPVVVTHARALLEGAEQAVVLHADVRDPDRILKDPGLESMIDLTAPAAVLMLSVLSAVPEDDLAARSVARFREALAPGSFVAVSHAISDVRPSVTAELSAMYQDEQIVSGRCRRDNLRTRSEVERFFAELELIDPGIVNLPAWRPDQGRPAADPASFWAVGGVGRRL